MGVESSCYALLVAGLVFVMVGMAVMGLFPVPTRTLGWLEGCWLGLVGVVRAIPAIVKGVASYRRRAATFFVGLGSLLLLAL